MKIKSLILTIGLSLLALSGLLAQDKYEFATVTYLVSATLKSGAIAVSKSGSYQEIAFKISEGSTYSNYSPLLEQVDKMNSEGWEVISVTTLGNEARHTIYHLRKKKN